MARKYLVTGGTGFIGSALVLRLLRAGHAVRVFDDGSRGRARRLDDRAEDVERVDGDIRDAAAVRRAAKGVDGICHLAYINGTRFFYEKPETVLEVAVKGMTSVVDACVAEGVGELILASSSEVYQRAEVIPTPETVPLVVPDVLNPRYSYGGGKILCELLAVNYGRRHIPRVIIFRPHNVYGPNMGSEHVIPAFALRMRELAEKTAAGPVPFPIQGTGKETRAFLHVEDCAEAVAVLIERGAHLGIYHVGSEEERTIEQVAHAVAKVYGREISIVTGPAPAGATDRRCPDISRLKALGFAVKVPFEAGLAATVAWYRDHGASPESP